MKTIKLFVFFGTLTCLFGCSTTNVVSFSCQEPQIEIYADGEYLGRDLVSYKCSSAREYVEVSCRENGVEVYSRNFYVKRKNGTLFEIQIPKNYRYSNKPY